MNRLTVRSLLTSAALAAAVALGGCNPSDIPTTGRAHAPLSDKMLTEIAAKNMDKDSPILVRLFKEESELEVWKKTKDGEFALLKTYPICRWSGDLGPKKKEGDRQAPEGFYTITPAQFNPNSNYYLAFNTGFPNAYDKSWGYTGSDLMVHGDCSSRGCYAMTDEQIQEIYALGRDSFFGGQRSFQMQAYPFRMTALNMAKHRNNPNFAFWKMIKEGYDNFEASKQEPKVSVCERRYVFDAAAPAGSTKPLNFSPSAKCPAYQIDPMVADAVLEHRRSEQAQMAEYTSRNVAVVPFRHGIDGGMNAVFASKLGGQTDGNGRTYQVVSASGPEAPGYLPRVPNSPPAGKPIVGTPQVASPVAVATAEPTEAAEEQPAAAPAAKPQTTVQMAKTKPAAAPVFRTASTPSTPVKLDSKPKAVAEAEPQLRLNKQEPSKQDKNDSQMRTAFTAPAAATNGTLAGAQPVVPTGSFDSRWSGFR